ncbi:copper homeostasis membrane protein CopD [Caulobacter sp. LARHSG274]
MLDAAIIVLRLVQFGGAMILFGSPLFFLYALPGQGPCAAAALNWPRRLLAWGAGILAIGAVLGLLAQTSVLAGSIRAGLAPDALVAVVTTMAMGPSSLVRTAAALAALGLLAWTRPGSVLWSLCALFGAVACASLAWMGHGAATMGAGRLIHLAGDIIHALAAALWIGALAAFLMLVRRSGPRAPEADQALHAALRGFSGIGSGIVALIVASGLVNAWFLVGPGGLGGLLTTPYGRLLSLKLMLFAAMLGLAAANRFRLTPALAGALGDPAQVAVAVARLRTSLVLETTAAIGVLALVAWLGALAPVSAQ